MIDTTGPFIGVTVLDQAGNEELLRIEDMRVLTFQYKDTERRADKLQLVVENFDLRNFDNPIWKQGNRIRVTWGYPGRMAPARTCVIRSVKGFTRLTVEAHALSVAMNRIPRSRTFENMTRIQVVRQIARENGYGDDAVDIESGSGRPPASGRIVDARRQLHTIRRERTRLELLRQSGGLQQAGMSERQYQQALGELADREALALAYIRRTRTPPPPDDQDPVLPHIVQANQTDAQFIRQLADQEGCEFYVDFDGFHFHPRRLDQAPVRTITYYIAQEKSEVIDFNIKSDVSTLPGRTRVRRRDPIERRPTEEQANNNTDPHRSTTGHVQVVTDDATGIDYNVRLASSEEVTRGASPPTAPNTAQGDARSRFRRNQQRAVQGTMKIIGDPYILAKSIIRIEGIGQRLSGNWYITEATHDVAPTGYTLSLSIVKDATGSYARRAQRRDEGLPDVASPRVRGNTSQGDAGNDGTGDNPDNTDSATTVTHTDRHTGLPYNVRVQHRGRDSRTGGGRTPNPASTQRTNG